MENLKIKVNSAEESKKAQELLVSIGGVAHDANQDRFGLIIFANNIIYSDWLTHEKHYDSSYDLKEITLQQLRDMAVLKRNDPKDATHIDDYNDKWLVNSLGSFNWCDESWTDKTIDVLGYALKPIEKEMKEYLEPLPNGNYVLVKSDKPFHPSWIEVPEGAEILADTKNGLIFYKKHDDRFAYCLSDEDDWAGTFTNPYDEIGAFVDKFLWQRSLNDKVASAEVARQDNVNNPSHYNKGGVECIDAIQSSMTKEAFCGYLKGNVQKYMWRYESKGHVESLKKAQWYLNKLIEVEAS